MIEVISGIVSALIAYVFNRLLIKRQKEKSIVFIIPLVEECSKTLIAIMMGGSIIGVHVVFGIIEALYDLLHTKSKNAATIAAVLSLISHSIFGIISNYIYIWTGWLSLGIIITTIIHSTWNYFTTH
jgi:hypothetical protein